MFNLLKKSPSPALTLLIVLSISSVANAGKPTGPKKKDCKAALTAVNLQDINFGSFVGGTGGTITIAANGSRTSTGGVILLSGSTSSAQFEVNQTLAGCEIYPLIIRPPNASTMTEPVGGTMAMSAFTSLPATGATLIPGTTLIVNIGATTTVTAGQAGGAYTTPTPYSITFRH